MRCLTLVNYHLRQLWRQIMSKVKIVLILPFMFLYIQVIHAEIYESVKMLDTLDLIRREKFDNVLPKAMRDNRIDMWIHVMGTKNGEEGNLDPLRLDLGSNTGIFVFTDRGGDRIERAVLGSVSDTVLNSGAYDIFAPESELRQFVSERDPKRIAVNFSESIAVADGISYTDYLKLASMLGDTYADRIVSAENLITDFRSRRVISEIVFYGKLCTITVDEVQRAFDIVEPGKTTLRDVSRWLRHQNMTRGYDSLIQLAFSPGLFIRDTDGFEHHSGADNDEYVIQRGDLFHIDYGTVMMNYRVDLKRVVYILREGETEAPPQIQKGFAEALRAREVFRKNIQADRTAGENFDALKSELERAGFHVANGDRFDPEIDPKKTQVTFGFHPLGNSWPIDGVGPTIGQRSSRAHLIIPRYHLFVLEYNIHFPTPELGKGKHIYLAIEDDVTVTERGVEFLYPPIKQIRLIR